jgi:hypothetical protein
MNWSIKLNEEAKLTIAKKLSVSLLYVNLALKFRITGKKAIDIRAMALNNGGVLLEESDNYKNIK